MTMNASSFSLYPPLVLNCQSPPHLCSLKQYRRCLEQLSCPSCQTPITMAGSAESRQIKIHSRTLLLGLKCLNLLQNSQASLPVQTRVGLIEEMSEAVRAINASVNDYPFRGIKGLEFLSEQAVNSSNYPSYAYALPAKKTAKIVHEFLKSHFGEKEGLRIIEYGAGNALWSRYFLAHGFDVLAIDCKKTQPLYVYLPKEGSFLKPLGRDILYTDEEKCALPPDCTKETLFLCWPENPDCNEYSMYAGRTLTEFRKRGGVVALYIGAPRGGTTAAEDFFDEIDAHWEFSLLSAKEGAFFSLDSTEFDALYLLKNKSTLFS